MFALLQISHTILYVKMPSLILNSDLAIIGWQIFKMDYTHIYHKLKVPYKKFQLSNFHRKMFPS